MCRSQESGRRMTDCREQGRSILEREGETPHMDGHVAAEGWGVKLEIDINKMVIDDLYNATIIPLMPMGPCS